MRNLSLLVVISSLSGACSAPPAESTASTAPLEESSVKPGINDRFLSPELEIDWAVGTFESESREIFTSRREIVEYMEISPGMAVADVGAGTGLFLGPLAGKVGPGGRVYAVDISPKLLEHIHRRVQEANLTQVEIVQGSGRNAELPDGSVDLVFVCDTYHHFEYPRAMLTSLHRALRPGGRLVVVDFERIPGVSREWICGHVRAGKEVFTAEIVAAGFTLEDEGEVEGLRENYVLRFRRS